MRTLWLSEHLVGRTLNVFACTTTLPLRCTNAANANTNAQAGAWSVAILGLSTMDSPNTTIDKFDDTYLDEVLSNDCVTYMLATAHPIHQLHSRMLLRMTTCQLHGLHR